MSITNVSFPLLPKVFKGRTHQPQRSIFAGNIFLLMLKVGKPMTAGLEHHMFCKLKKLRKPSVIPIYPVLNLPEQLSPVDTVNSSTNWWLEDQLQATCCVVFCVDQKNRSCSTFRERMTSECTVTGQNLFLNEYLIRRCKYLFK